MSAIASPAVAARHESLEAMRAELAGITAERDALKAELEDAAWERDQAQNESAFMREDVLHGEGYYEPGDNESWSARSLGLLLTSGDTPPAPPADIALISLSTGVIYVRANSLNPDTWCEYGQDTVYSDWSNMAGRGPWITTATAGLLDHRSKADARRRLVTAVYSARPYQRNIVPWPESAEWALDRVKALAGDFRSTSRPDAWIETLSVLAGAVRAAWQAEHARADKLAAAIEATS